MGKQNLLLVTLYQKYCNRAILVQVIVENVVAYFLRHSIFTVLYFIHIYDNVENDESNKFSKIQFKI